MSTEDIGTSVRTRVPYEPIHRRRALQLPGNARVAVWTIVNVENWQPSRSMPRVILPPPRGQPRPLRERRVESGCTSPPEWGGRGRSLTQRRE